MDVAYAKLDSNATNIDEVEMEDNNSTRTFSRPETPMGFCIDVNHPTDTTSSRMEIAIYALSEGKVGAKRTLLKFYKEEP